MTAYLVARPAPLAAGTALITDVPFAAVIGFLSSSSGRLGSQKEDPPIFPRGVGKDYACRKEYGQMYFFSTESALPPFDWSMTFKLL